MSLAKTHLNSERDVNNDIAGIKIPDSQMARDLTQLIRDTEPDLLFHHSTRVYLFGALTGKRKGLMFDAELLYVGAMFHDIGLTETYRSSEPLGHSMTSSARASSVGGTSSPRAFAVFRLITSSYLVGACTGRSAGFSPRRTSSLRRN